MSEDIFRLFEIEKNQYVSNHLEILYNKYKTFLQNELNKRDNREELIENLLLSINDNFPIISYKSGIDNNFIPRIINCSIMNGNIGELESALINLLDLSLERIMPFNNNTVYRMVNTIYIEDIKKEIKLFKKNIGQIFTVEHFLSTSKVNWGEKVVWVIETLPCESKAKDIDILNPSINKKNGEMEVLFTRNSKFQINEVKKSNNHCEIHLKEVHSLSKSSLVFKNQLINQY